MQTSHQFQSSTRFIAKLFGERNHDYLSIDSDTTLSISKTQIDKFEKKAQISQWKFELDQIYSEDNTFDQLYENEIDCNDFLNQFSAQSTYRNIIFVCENSDTITSEPFLSFIRNCISECVSSLSSSLIPLLSFVEVSKTHQIDKIANKSISSSKVLCYEDDIVISDASQVPISALTQLDDLMKIAAKSLRIEQSSVSSSEIITLRLCDKETNYCYSKINFVLYRAYELSVNDASFKIFTKDNYTFFNSVNRKINSRLSYIMKYIKDVFDSEKGKNLFIMFVPCNFEYLILMHDMLNYVKMRKLILTVVDDDKVDELSKGIEEIAMSEEKENDDPNMTRAESNTSTVKKERRSLNIERLKKIENKKQIMSLFDALDKI